MTLEALAVPRATSAQESNKARIGWTPLAVIAAQLLLVLLLRQYEIENTGFHQLAQFAFAGFVIHALVKRRLTPYAEDILRFVYHHIAEGARQRSFQPAWIFLPATDHPRTYH